MSPHTVHVAAPLLQPEEVDPEASMNFASPANLEVDHDALIGDELTTERAIDNNPTIANLGNTPFSDDGDEAEYHKIVATEVVPDPVQWSEPEPILQNALVLVDPRIADCREMIASANRRGLFVTAVVPKPNLSGKKVEYYPTTEALLEVGVHQVYEPPLGSHFDVIECANHLQTLESQQNLRYLGVIPLREAAVDISDVLAALLGLAVHNDLGLSSARRDKGLMKLNVANAGLRVAKFARLTAPDGSDVPDAIKNLELDFPVVVKTPRGMSTIGVYICQSMEEVVKRSGEIVRSVGPDGKKALFALLEEFIEGDEFAVNIVASPTTPRGVQVTDVWWYNKVLSEGTYVNTWQDMVDPHDSKYSNLVRYGEGIARAVGIKYGFAHVELKAEYDAAKDKYVDPVMIEVGARLAGGRKAIMAQATVPGWLPFDAMVDAHCGFPVRVPPSFRPVGKARHVFIPSDKAGTVKSMKGTDFDRLGTYNAHVMMVELGQKVKKSTDLLSFAGYCWLIGSEEDVERDTKSARGEFVVEVEEQQES
uniref:ATP-grasp domain-containing protein n=1 Tax=Odontella aurita TaxID=265563 RepID=A0A7S4I5S5_9STRA|mmetsp:Transcript_20283/g.58642  ORF Transcript_20283/g.58642 Transcript_20283/m.58642 type:complete len:537 (+) Transcript_20283:266-1876(+)